MAKLCLLTLLTITTFVQISYARDVAEVLNANIRHQLGLYDMFKLNSDGAKFADDLSKLIKLTENVLKAETVDEKHQMLSSIPGNFSEDFNTWVIAQVEEALVNEDINEAVEFYKSLLTSNPDHETEIKATISTLESLYKEFDLKKKKEKILSLDKTFSPSFQKFLKDNALPNINRQLQKTVDFFEDLLRDKEIKFAKEIEVLKTKTEAALSNDVAIDEKNKVLHEVTFTDNEELNKFLHTKNIENS